jgi:hypothetical protein
LLIRSQETRSFGNLKDELFTTEQIFANPVLNKFCQELAMAFRDKELQQKSILAEQ